MNALKQTVITYERFVSEDLRFRPIVAGPACETHRLSNLIDILLKPIIEKVKSYVRDDIDFLNYIPKTVQSNTLLVSFDIVNLYTNIPHELGIEQLTVGYQNILN